MLDFFNSLHNASLFCPRSGPKSCRCAAQTPADAGFLQAFDLIRGGLRPLVLPLQKRTLFLQTGFFDKLRETGYSGLSYFSSRIILPQQPFSVFLICLLMML